MREMRWTLIGGLKRCKCCGARMLFQGYHSKTRLTHIMKRDQICYDCAFWIELKECPPDNLEIIGNKCLKIGPVGNKRDKSTILGGKGRMHYYMRSDLSVFQSNDIWLIGAVPERFKADFQPTAVEITGRVFNRLANNSKQCKARGCFDRYKCLRYNIELEKKGPFNTIPPFWKVGGERCKYFINSDTIYIDETSVDKNKINNGQENNKTQQTGGENPG